MGRKNTLAIVVVGGSTKDIGKTALVCAVISAFSEFDWTAVKITGHSYEPEASASGEESESTEATVWEEMNAGQATDTARYLAAGARRALLVTRYGPEVPIDVVREVIATDRNVIFESNRIMDAIRPDLCVTLVGAGLTEVKPSFLRLLQKADALVTLGEARTGFAELSAAIPRFHLQSVDQLPPEMVNWLESRLARASQPDSKA